MLSSVTANKAQEDLVAFHQRHFKQAIDKENLSGAFQAAQAGFESAQNLIEDPDDDGLGFYEDGVKRTLTDEQVAMFRHSEIQRLLMERKLRSREHSIPNYDDYDESMQNTSSDKNETVKPLRTAQSAQRSKEVIEESGNKQPELKDVNKDVEGSEQEDKHDEIDQQPNVDSVAQAPAVAAAQADQRKRPVITYDDM